MSIIEYELPQGSPTVQQVSSAVGYCTASDVVSLNKVRSNAIGLQGQPTFEDIQGYILMSAGQIDAALTNKGYQTPVNTASFPEAQGLLCWVNATGAWWMMEAASPDSTNVDRAKKAFDEAMKMLVDANLSLDVPSDQDRSQIRAPWITMQPDGRVFDPTMEAIGGYAGDGISANTGGVNRRSLPFFSRSMRF